MNRWLSGILSPSHVGRPRTTLAGWRRRPLALERLEDRLAPALVLALQEAGVNGGALTVVATAADFTSVSFTGTYGDFKVTISGGSSDNGASLSDLLSSATSVRNLSGTSKTLNVWVSQTDYTLPAGSPLSVESGLGGSVNPDAVGLTNVFQAYADKNNNLFGTSDFTNGPQSATRTGATFVTGSATGLFNRTVGDPFSLSGHVAITLTGGGQVNFSGHVNTTATVHNVPTVVLNAPTILSVGGVFTATGSFTDPGQHETDTATVNYGDGTPGHPAPDMPLTLNADGSFRLSHTFSVEGIYTVTVKVTDSSGGTGVATTTVVVLPAGARNDVEASRVTSTPAGGSANATLTDPNKNVTLNLTYDNGASANVSFLAVYSHSPTSPNAPGLYFDLKLLSSDVSNLTLTVTAPMLKGDFRIGYIDPRTGKSVSLLNNPDVVLSLDKITGTLKVTFLKTDFLTGTVFGVTLAATTSTSTTATIQPATASASDSPRATGASVTFTSNTQLSVALTASQGSQLSVSGAAQGSQSGATGPTPSSTSNIVPASAAGSTANGGGEELQRGPVADRDEVFRRWLEERAAPELWKHGLDLWWFSMNDEPGPGGADHPVASGGGADEQEGTPLHRATAPAEEAESTGREGPAGAALVVFGALASAATPGPRRRARASRS
jgi:hypothetical protein